MANLKKVFTGVILFFTAYFFTYLLYMIAPPLIEAMETATSFDGSGFTGIIWLGIIMVWIGSTIILPNIYIITGMREQDPEGGPDQPIIQIMIAILLFIFTMIFTYKAWYIITAIPTITSDGFITAIYWVGAISIWLEMQLILPAYMVLQNIDQ